MTELKETTDIEQAFFMLKKIQLQLDALTDFLGAAARKCKAWWIRGLGNCFEVERMKAIENILLYLLLRIFESKIRPEYDDELSRKIDMLKELAGR